ncbi:MAG: CHAD domain-containing protein, partial [Elusimicrobia bacterium]|nr:CHAD domain-containing protein [Elusimicrobiota bacterium]
MKADLFLLPAREGARRLVLGLLREAEAAAARLGQRGDAEALHDLRVALHRLGCFLRDYRRQLSQVPSSLRKGFKKLATATNPVRDKEAGIELLKAFAGNAAPEEKASLLAAAGLLKARGNRRGQGFAAGIKNELARLAAGLRTAVSSGARGAA